MRPIPLLLCVTVLIACGGDGPNDPGGGDGNLLTATADGQPFTASSVQASPVASTPGSLAFVGTQTSGGVARSMLISLAFISGPGTYPLGTNIGTTPGGTALFIAGTSSFSTPLSGDAGSITISSLSATRATGTFSFTATPLVAGGANAVVSAGRFDVPTSPGYTAPTAEQAGSVMTATINGAPVVSATVVGIGGGSGTRVLGGQGVTWAISITVGPITVPGSGPLTATGSPIRRITVSRVGTTQSWGGGTGTDNGTLTITAISPTRISGTFSGTLAANAQTAGTLTIANGTFDVRTPTQ